MPEYRKALDGYQRAADLDPKYLYACSNQVDLHVAIAEYLYSIGEIPTAEVDQAEKVSIRCFQIDSSYYNVMGALTRGQLVLARHLLDRGDPTDALARARSHVARLEKASQGSAEAALYRATADVIEAEQRFRDGYDPLSAIAKARLALQEAVLAAPSIADTHTRTSELDILQARWLLHANTGSAEPALARARNEAERAIALDSSDADSQFTAGRAYLETARALHMRSLAETGLRYVERALAINPRMVRAQALRLELQQLVTR
jgi:tetratricopeptide (TPR) repeat protein